MHGESESMRGNGVSEAQVKTRKNNDNNKQERVPRVVKLVRHQYRNIEAILIQGKQGKERIRLEKSNNQTKKKKAVHDARDGVLEENVEREELKW